MKKETKMTAPKTILIGDRVRYESALVPSAVKSSRSQKTGMPTAI